MWSMEVLNGYNLFKLRCVVQNCTCLLVVFAKMPIRVKCPQSVL